jgi:hypothetical protein
MDVPELAEIQYVYCDEEKLCPISSCNLSTCIQLQQSGNANRAGMDLDIVTSRSVDDSTHVSSNHTEVTSSSSNGAPALAKWVPNSIILLCILLIFTTFM